MAEEAITYDKIETGDPDPLGLEAKLKAAKAAKSPKTEAADPLGLEAKLRAIKEPAQQPKQEQPAFKPMTDWLNVQGYQPMVPENAVNPHNIETEKSSERIENHLADIDNSVRNLLYEHKKDLTGRIKSQELGINPSEQGPINFQAQQLVQKDKQDVYVSPVEVESFKNEIPNNPVLLRRSLEQKAKDLSKTNPADAAMLKADIYRVDRQNNPEKENKIAKNVEGIKNGEFDYDIVNGQLIKPEGFLGGLATGYKEKVQAFDDYGVYKTGDKKAILDLINKRLKYDPDEAAPQPKGEWVQGFFNEMARMAGGQPLKPLIGGAAAGLAGPEAGVAAASAITAPEMYKLTFGATLPHNYAAIKKVHPDWSEEQQLQEAIDFTNNQANIDALSGAAMGVLGAKAGMKPTGLNSNLLQRSLGSALKQVGQESVKKTLEGLGVGTIGASGQLVKNLMAQQEGIPVDESEGLKEQLLGGLKMTAGMHMIAKFPELLKPKTYNQLLQSFKNVPKDQIASELNNLQQSGQITEEQAKNAQTAIKEHADIDNSIKPNVPLADRLKVQEKIKERNKLDANLETEDKAYHTDTKEQIKNLNDQINRVSKGEERGELQQLIDKESKDENIKGYTAETLKNASENDLKRYFKEISEQAHDPNSEATARVTFGDNIVNKAKELYPQEQPKESKISVIKSGEIKHPETTTIAPKEIGAGKVPSEQVGHVEITEHGEDTKTAAGKENGIGPAPLTKEGLQEAQELGKYIADNNKTKIITSEVERGLQTAEEAAKEAKRITGKDIPIERNELLNTANIGNDEGKPEGTFKEKDWFERKYMPEGAESPESFKERMEKAYQYVKSLPEDTHVVSHSKVMRAFDALSKTDGKWTDETTNIFLNNKELTHAKDVRGNQGQLPEVGQIGRGSQETGGYDLQQVPSEPPISGETQQQTGIPTEEDKAKGQEGITPPVLPGAKNVYAEHPATQLSFRGLQEVANEFGYEDVKSRERVTDVQERKNAEITASEWAEKGEYQQNVDDLLDRIERREHVPTAKQRLILEQYLANERQKVREMPKNSPEYDRQLLKLQRIKDIGQIARQEAGAALRLPNEGTLPHPITDESSAMIAKMEANSVDKLTDQQKADVEAQVEKYRKANNEANVKIAELEAQVAKLDAQKEFNKTKSTTKRTKKTAEERVAFRRTEIEAAREALRKLRSGESGLSAVPLPGVRELIAIAPHVKNIMVDLVAQGVDNLQDVISNLHSEFKDVLEGLTEKNIHDIISGEYNEPSRPLSELQRQVKDLQEEAKLINQLESLERGIEPKSEKAKRERNQKIKELRDKIKDARKAEGSQDLISIKERNEKQAKKIREKIAKGQFEKEVKKSIFDREDVKSRLPQLRKQALDAIAKKEEAQHEFDLALFNDEMSKRSRLAKLGGFAGKLIHTSKALLSGIDDSATFVQNGLLMLANPKVGAKAWLAHAKDAFSPARFKRELAAIHADPDWEVISKSGLEVVEPHSAASKQVEEAFEKNLLAQIEIKGIKPWEYTGGIFERAFTSMGNNLRVLLFKERMQMLRDEGKTFESHPQEYKDAARAINELSGRGKLPEGLAQAAPYITPFIWAPRLLTSTINALGLSDITYTLMGRGEKGYYRNLTPMQRRYALGQLGRGVGVGVAIMGLAALGGAKVDYDPRSVTFGDIIVGDHHYNVFGRFTPIIKTIVQATLGARVKAGGEVQDLDNGKWGAKTRAGVVGGFFRGKTTPAFGAALNLAEGRNYFTNQPFTVKDLPSALLQPMSIKELTDGWKNDGTVTILNRFLPAFEGLKVSDERDFNKNSGLTAPTSITPSREKPTRIKPTRVNPHKR